MKKLILPLLLMAFISSGCSKDDDDDNKTCELNTTNIVGVYKTTAVTYKATPNSPEEDEYINWAPCEKDDLIVFSNNGAGNIQDAGAKCTPPGDDTFTWTLTGNILTLDGFIASTVTSFDCTTMKISLTDPTGGVTVTTVVRQ